MSNNSLENFQKDHFWLYRHSNELMAEYKEKWVAVQNQRVIDSDNDLEFLCQRLENPGNIYIDYLTTQPLNMIL